MKTVNDLSLEEARALITKIQNIARDPSYDSVKDCFYAVLDELEAVGLDVTEARELGERAGRADRLRALGNLAAGLARVQEHFTVERMVSGTAAVYAALAGTRHAADTASPLQAD